MGGVQLKGGSMLNPDQELIEMAVKGFTQEDIAKKLGLSSRQVRRRMEKPHIRKAIKKYCDLLWENRLRRVANNFDKMESVFVDLMDDENPYLKLQASIQMRNLCFHGREIELSQDVEELREELKHLKEQLMGVPVDDEPADDTDDTEEDEEPSEEEAD